MRYVTTAVYRKRQNVLFFRIHQLKLTTFSRKYLLSGKSNSSTGNMNRHLVSKNPEQLDNAQEGEPEAFVSSKCPTEYKVSNLLPFQTFSQENFRKALLKWVIECNQPFTEPQQDAFVALIRTLNPDTVVVSNVTIKNDLLAAYAAALNDLKAEIAKIPGKISITMDAWTSTNSLAFLAIRGHWLDDQWEYHSKLLDFAHIEGDPSGFHLSQIFGDCLSRLNIPYTKIMGVTLDNATNNDTFFDWLQQHGITAVDNQMRCMAHIINLSVQDILSAFLRNNLT